MDPVTGAALLSGGASLLSNLLGGLFGSSSNSSTNETNLQIAREQNQLNRELLANQQQFSIDMWNKQNEYNSPKAQAARLRDAGINPLVLGSGVSNVAGSIGLPNAQPAVGATMRPYDYQTAFANAGQGIANSVDAYFRNRNIESVTHKNEAETKRTSELTPWEIRQLQMLTRKGGIEADLAHTELVYQNAIQGQKIAQVFGDTALQQKSLQLMDKQMLMHDLQNKLFEVQLSYAPRLNDAQLRQYYATVSQIKAQVGLISEQANLTSEQRLNEAAKRVGIIVDNGLKGLDFNLKKQTLSTSVDLLKEDLFEKQDLRYLRPYEFNYQMQGNAGKWLPSPSGQYGAAEVFERNLKRDRFKK